MPKQVQIFGVATYDALFKYVLSGDNLRPSFFHAFLPGLHITKSTRLDDHMNPLKELQRLRTFLSHPSSEKAARELYGASDFDVRIYEKGQDRLISDPALTEFLKGVVSHYDDIKFAFPEERYDGTMDFVCQLDGEDYALVEMQIAPQNYGDLRSLAYIASFYGNQLFKGQDFVDLKRVIGINLLGGGKDKKHHWKDTPHQYVRHYKFEEQLNDDKRFINGLELIQYSVMNAPRDNSNQEQKDWLTFFKSAHEMTPEQVQEQIKTQSVLEAFERAKYADLPQDVRKGYDAQAVFFGQYSQHTEETVKEAVEEVVKEVKAEAMRQGIEQGLAKGIEQGIEQGLAQGLEQGELKKMLETATRMINLGLDDELICASTGISLKDLLALKNTL